MATEVMTIQNISNTFPFKNSYCQTVTYNNYIYVNTATAIYRYDYINNISTTIYTKTYSSYSIDSAFTPICIKDNILYWGSHIGYKSTQRDYSEWVYIGTYNLLNNTVNEQYMTVREILHNSSMNATLYSGRGFMYIKDNYIYLNQAINAYITVGYDNAVYEINTDTNTYVKTNLSYVPMSNLDYGYYASAENIGSSYTNTNRFGEVQGRSNSLITTFSGNIKHNNQIYILGGYDTNSSSTVNSIRLFDLSTNSYTTLSETLPETRRTPAVAQTDENTFYIILNNYITIIHFEVYNSNSISIGALALSASYIGASEVNKIYFGTSLVYEKQASGYSVTITNDVDNAGECFYSLDDGATWVDIGNSQEATIQLTNVTQIKFKADNPGVAYWGRIISSQLNLNVDGDIEVMKISQNYILTQNITDVRAYTYYD